TFSGRHRLEFLLIRVGGIERDPEEDEAGVIVVAARFGASDPADGAMRAQTHGFGKVTANGALLGFQRRVVENILHSQSPSENSITARRRNPASDTLRSRPATRQARSP